MFQHFSHLLDSWRVIWRSASLATGLLRLQKVNPLRALGGSARLEIFQNPLRTLGGSASKKACVFLWHLFTFVGWRQRERERERENKSEGTEREKKESTKARRRKKRKRKIKHDRGRERRGERRFWRKRTSWLDEIQYRGLLQVLGAQKSGLAREHFEGGGGWGGGVPFKSSEEAFPPAQNKLALAFPSSPHPPNRTRPHQLPAAWLEWPS